MNNLILDRGNFGDFTSVSNIFIDEFMPKANGEFIKIYLHLLRVFNSNDIDLSITTIADRFNILESDVNRALAYWAEEGLLSLSYNDSNAIVGIRLEALTHNKYLVQGIVQTSSEDKNNILDMASGDTGSISVPESKGFIVPAKKKYSPKEISSFGKDENFKQLTFLAETYLGKTLNSTDINSILYMLDSLKLSSDFIEYIMEDSVSKNHKTLSYIEKQAVEYFKKDINSEEEAKLYGNLREEIYKSIYKIFGLTFSSPIRKEVLYISKWTNDFAFSDEIILEACERTMEHTHKGSFQYTDGILTNWHNSKVRSLSDVKKLDKAHNEKSTKDFQGKAVRPRKAKTFKQRTYNYSDLDKKLFKAQEERIKKVLSESKND